MNTGLTVNDYLDNLELDRQDMINSLKSKGMEISDSATFTEIVPKMDGLVDINEYMSDTITYGDYNTGGWVKTLLKFRSPLKVEGTNANYMFYNYPFNKLPDIDTSKVTSMQYMFGRCKTLTTIPELNTVNVTNMHHIFSECELLTTIPQLDTSNVTNMESMFRHCHSLTTVPQLDTSKVTNTNSMFQDCASLTSIPELDTSKVTNINSMFGYCKKLITIPQLNTSNATSMNDMFSNCEALTTVPQLDASKVDSVNNMFTLCRSLTTLGGLTNLGQAYLTTASANYWLYTLTLNYSNNLTHESLMNVINNLYDIATKGCQPQQLILGSTNLAKLSEEEILIVTNKGWTVS